jgi:hypothetical protein
MDQGRHIAEPAAAELRVTGEIGGVPVQGYIDVMDVNGDVKTASKKPSGVRADYRIQVGTPCYRRGFRENAAPDPDEDEDRPAAHANDPCHRGRSEAATKLYQIAQEGMRSGLYMPNRGSFVCSRRYCSFWAGLRWRSMGVMLRQSVVFAGEAPEQSDGTLCRTA